MRALPSATMLCRVLIGLDRTAASGTLHVWGQGHRAAMMLDSGRVAGVTLDRIAAPSPHQVVESVVRMCRWEGLVLRLRQSPSAASGPVPAVWMPARAVGLQSMRAVVNGLDCADPAAELGDAVYHLTVIGEALFLGAELRPEEAAVLFWLRRGVSARALADLPGCGLRGRRFLWMLGLLRAASPKAGGSYPLLLRKRREVRGQASAHTLLDLPEGAGGRDARLALRKLVRDLHPDRFGDRAPVSLRRASSEIMTALVDAEARIASGRAS
jgi:hypothetical protein